MEIMGVIGVMVNCALIGNYHHYHYCRYHFESLYLSSHGRPVRSRAPAIPGHDQRQDRAPDHCVGAPHAAPQVPHLRRHP